MIPIQIEILEYNKDCNDCKAKLQNGNIITIDPFMEGAIKMTDEEYEQGKGYEIVGRSYVLTSYLVHTHYVIVEEDGMKAI